MSSNGGNKIQLDAHRVGLVAVETMEIADILKASIKVCMFDQYGTIVDMQAGLTEIAKPYLESKGGREIPTPSLPGGAARISKTR